MAETVALIIPTYSRADLVIEAIDSALSQTRVPDEIIVVDDGSTDDTWERLQRYTQPVVALRHQVNQGRAAARNTGLKHCTADLICFLDSDDLLTPESIELRASWLESHPRTGIVYGRTRSVDMASNRVNERVLPAQWPPKDMFARLARHNTVAIHISSYMLQRRYLPPIPCFETRLEPLEDWGFILAIAAQYPEYHRLEETVSLYRHHANMTLPPNSSFTHAHVAIMNRIYTVPAFHALPRGQQARIYCSHAIERMTNGYGSAARQSLLGSIRVASWYAIAYPLWLSSWIAPSVPKKLVGMLNSCRAKLVRD